MSEWGKYNRTVTASEAHTCQRCGLTILIRIINSKAAKPSAAGWKKIRGYWYCKECKVTA